MTRATYTLASLEISSAAYQEIENKLREAGYDHVFHEDGIDMTHILICSIQPEEIRLVVNDEDRERLQKLIRESKGPGHIVINEPRLPGDIISFLQNLVERCEHGDINEDCEDEDWRHIYLEAKRLLNESNAN